MGNEEKKAAVRRLYDEVILKGDAAAAEELMLETYIQHNPLAESGRDGLLKHVADLNAQFTERRAEMVHLFCDGDYVITHIHFTLGPNGHEAMGMDVFRFEGDKIAEHWDVIQVIPDQAANDNTMY